MEDLAQKHVKLLVVDDEALMCELLQYNLRQDGYQVDTCNSAEEALGLDLPSYSLIILDIMMGEMSGMTLAHRLKQNPSTAHIPIIFCSARDSEQDIIDGLSSGADDYVPKPFSMQEMKARVKAILTRKARKNTTTSDKIPSIQGLTLDETSRSITLDGEKVQLTNTEYAILSLFLKNRNKLFNRQEIFAHVWPDKVVVSDRTIDVNISRIRKKLGHLSANLINRSGFGYGFME